MFGLTLQFLQDHGYDYTPDTIKTITKAKAYEIYQDCIWTPCHIGDIANDAIASQVFDITVNSGHTMAVRLLQRSIAALGVPINVDSMWGPQTLKLCNQSPVVPLNNTLVSMRLQFYNSIVISNPTQSKYLKGWTARARSYLL